MAQYATLVPKPDTPPPANTGHGWAFQHNSLWLPIGPDHPYPLDVAEHGLSFFSHRDESGGLSVALVDMNVFEGELTLQVAQQDYVCPVDGCGQVFHDVASYASHIKECAIASVKPARGRAASSPGGDQTGDQES